jgi:hypothetical protein
VDLLHEVNVLISLASWAALLLWLLHGRYDGEQAHKKQGCPTGQADQHIHLMKKIHSSQCNSSFSVP